MQSRGVHLQYTFQPDGQRGAQIHNPLFDLLSAVQEHGSIQHAAKAMGASYRHVWGALKHWEEVLGEALVTWAQGQPARLTPFAHRLLWAETRARARLTPHIEALRAELERVLSEALDGSQQVLTLYASHDLALPALREHASQAHRLHIELKFAGSMDALRALAEGRCVVAGFHVPPMAHGQHLFAQALKPLLTPGRYQLIGCTRRTQGLMLAKGNPLKLRNLRDLAQNPVRYINRQAGSGTRLLADHLLAAEGVNPALIGQYHSVAEENHLAVAAAIASGLGDAGLGLEAAAQRFGLDFMALVEEDYFLICHQDALEHPAIHKLCEALQGPGWAKQVAELPGYALAQSGHIRSLTKALPWWNA